MQRLSPIRSTFPPRSRIDSLLTEALHHRVVTIVAGVGYGKTTALTQFFSAISSARTVWMPLTASDNLPVVFKQHFIEATRPRLPQLAAQMEAIPFPETDEGLESLFPLRVGPDAGTGVIIVLDDLHLLTNERIRAFLAFLAEAALPNATFILSSASKRDVFLGADYSDKTLLAIGPNELSFTAREIEGLLDHHDIAHTPVLVQQILTRTEGWPFLVDLICRQLEARQQTTYQESQLDLSPLDILFSSCCFDDYAPAMRMLLIKLALLPHFTLELIQAIGGCDLVEAMQIIQSHMYIAFDHVLHVYRFLSVYQRFLLEKQPLLSAEDVHHVNRVAGNWFLSQGDFVQAARAFSHCNAYGRLVETIFLVPHERMDEGLASEFISHLENVPQAYMDANPRAVILYARMHMYREENDLAERMLRALEAKLSAEGSDARMLSEVYLALGQICLFRSDTEALQYMQKAAKGLPHGSMFRAPLFMRVYNNSSFFLYQGKQGEIQRIERNIRRIAEITRTLYGGLNSGVEYLYIAEGAFLTMSIDRAQENAFHAVYAAFPQRQHDILCNAWFLLGRIAVMQGQLDKADAYFDKITHHITDGGLAYLYNLRDSAVGWLQLKIHNFDAVPEWITDLKASPLLQMPEPGGRDLLLNAAYHLEKGDFAQALAMVQALMPYCKERHLWVLELNLNIMEAICQKRLGHDEAAVEALHRAYSMSHESGILLPFVEAGTYMRALVEHVERVGDDRFDAGWLHTVQSKASTYAKRLASIAREQKRGNPRDAFSQGPKLSDRELEVLENLVQGLTREEISAVMGISINGVKKHITSIYNKLGAINRADAVFIATTQGIIR